MAGAGRDYPKYADVKTKTGEMRRAGVGELVLGESGLGESVLGKDNSLDMLV